MKPTIEQLARILFEDIDADIHVPLILEDKKAELPSLPYSYSALEPHIDVETMRVHHKKHHQKYVDNFNAGEEKTFNGGGHFMHSIFWKNMSPNGGGKPSGELLESIDQKFGDFDSFKEKFTEEAKSVQGCGWAILAWQDWKLNILTEEKHPSRSSSWVPLLVLDMWEHAYYLKHKNDKESYIKAFFNVINWGDVSERFQRGGHEPG